MQKDDVKMALWKVHVFWYEHCSFLKESATEFSSVGSKKGLGVQTVLEIANCIRNLQSQNCDINCKVVGENGG